MMHARIVLVTRALAVAAVAVAAPAAVAQLAAGADTGVVRVCVGGDVSLGTNLDTSWVDRDAAWMRRRPRALPEPARLLAPLVPLVADADVVLVNLEGAIGDGPVATPKCAPGATGCYALRMPETAAAALRGLRAGGRVVANVANNHARDAGADGLARTVALLDAAGVLVTGADTLATPVGTAEGDTVAVLGFGTSGEPDLRDLAAVRRHVARAAARYPRLVVTMHAGAEGALAQRTRDTMETYRDERRGNPVAFAHAAVAAGAKLVVGHGPHVLRAIEWHDGALIAYSLGNLVTYGPFGFEPPRNRGALLCASLDARGRVTRAALRPTRQRAPGFVRADWTARAAVLMDSLSRLDFPGTSARLTPEVAVRRP